MKRLEMPVFSRENPNSWLFRAEHYFDIHQLTDKEKIYVAVISFKPEIVEWYKYAHNRKKIATWEELKERIYNQFRPSQEKVYAYGF